MSTHSDSVERQSPAPGFIKSFLIHLAGADPKVFPYLPAHEATDFAKLGASVIVPGLLALTAGTFTIWHMNPQLGWPVAILFGLLWAMIVLIIDVAVMSQLVKPCKVPPPPPPAPLSNRGPVRAFVDDQPEVAAPLAEPEAEEVPWIRNKLIGALRICIAIVLGLFMSHSLILTFFHKRIEQKTQSRRVIDQTKLQSYTDEARKAEEILAYAEKAANTKDSDEAFRRWYNEYTLKKGAANAAAPAGSSEGTEATASPPVDATSKDAILTTLDGELAEVVVRQSAEIDKITAQITVDEAALNDLRSDLREGKTMEKAELRGGEVQSFTFKTAAFRFALGEKSSGISGTGSRSAKIKQFLAEQNELEKTNAKKLADLKSQLETKKSAHSQEQDAIQAKIVARKAEIAAKVANMTKEEEERRKKAAEQERLYYTGLRQQLDADIVALRKTRDYANDRKLEALKPYQGSSDFLEETAALLELIFNAEKPELGAPAPSAFQQPVFVSVVLVVFLSLILIDLAPLMMKLLRMPSSYDMYLAMARQQRLQFPFQTSIRVPSPPQNEPPPRAYPNSHSVPVPPPSQRQPPPPPPGGGGGVRRI